MWNKWNKLFLDLLQRFLELFQVFVQNLLVVKEIRIFQFVVYLFLLVVLNIYNYKRMVCQCFYMVIYLLQRQIFLQDLIEM